MRRWIRAHSPPRGDAKTHAGQAPPASWMASASSMRPSEAFSQLAIFSGSPCVATGPRLRAPPLSAPRAPPGAARLRRGDAPHPPGRKTPQADSRRSDSMRFQPRSASAAAWTRSRRRGAPRTGRPKTASGGPGPTPSAEAPRATRAPGGGDAPRRCNAASSAVRRGFRGLAK